MNLDDHLFEEFEKHFNCRCIMIKIKVLDLPDQTPFVIGGRYKSIEELLCLPTMPAKILFMEN